MKIGPSNEVQPAPVAAVKAVERTPAVGAAATGVPVSVSAAVRSLDATSAGSGIDEAKVAEVRAAIAGGTFRVDAGNVADRLLSNAQEILGRTRG